MAEMTMEDWLTSATRAAARTEAELIADIRRFKEEALRLGLDLGAQSGAVADFIDVLRNGGYA